MDIYKLVNDFYEQNTDAERWQWFLDNKSLGLGLMLDNDVTWIEILNTDMKNEDHPSLKFESSIGNSEGVYDMLTAMEITFDIA